MTELRADNVTIEADGNELVSNVSLELRQGELVAVLGPNGAGKTTLLRGLLGLTGLTAGSCRLDGQEVGAMSPRSRARRVSYLPQQRPLAWPNKVMDIVALGRFAHGAALGRLSPDDQAAVDQAIDQCDLSHLTARSVDNLSGGELARVHFARAIAAQAPLLLADEPTAALDPRHQLSIARFLRQFVDAGGGALVVLHDITLAADIADRLVWMTEGQIVAEGPPGETLTEQIMAQVYGVQAHIAEDDYGLNVRVSDTR